jgi:hypothetical protein
MTDIDSEEWAKYMREHTVKEWERRVREHKGRVFWYIIGDD